MSNQPARNLVIYNHRASAVILRSSPESKNPIHKKGQILAPGENNVDEGYWKYCCKSKAHKIMLAAEILENKGDGEAKELGAALNGVTSKEAKKQIEKATQIKLLQRWRADDKRVGVQKMCDDRIKQLIDEQDGEEK